MLYPKLDNLPEAQRLVWPDLQQLPAHFVLYGGTALALRLGHRESVDFDFFSSHRFEPEQLLREVPFLRQAKILQASDQTLTVAVDRGSPVKISCFGGLTIGRVGEPEGTHDGVLKVASILDLAGTKAAAVVQRAESKDYLDLLAICQSGVSLKLVLGAARALYGDRYNPILTLKALTYFKDGDLDRLPLHQRNALLEIARSNLDEIGEVVRVSDQLSPQVKP